MGIGAHHDGHHQEWSSYAFPFVPLAKSARYSGRCYLEMNSCARCGFQTPGGRFCAECGVPFTSPAAPGPQLFPSASRSQSERALSDVPLAVPVAAGPGLATQRSQSARMATGSIDTAKIGHGGFAEQPETAPRTRSAGSNSSFALLKGRYADHPECDVCHTTFDVTRRRHQWCVK